MFLARFCRARKWDIKLICEMFTNYMKYRADNKIDTIQGVSQFHIIHTFSMKLIGFFIDYIGITD